MVPEMEPHILLGPNSTELAWDSLSPSLYAPPPARMLFLSLKINKNLKKKKAN